MMQHKWHKEIKAWADGAEIEFRYVNRLVHKDDWEYCDYPDWNDNQFSFRIKPQPKEPQYLYVYKHECNGISFGYKPHEALNMWQTKIIGKIKLEDE